MKLLLLADADSDFCAVLDKCRNSYGKDDAGTSGKILLKRLK